VNTVDRSHDRHIDNEELNALAPSAEPGQQPQRLSAEDIRSAERHLESCADCSLKLANYREVVERDPRVVVSEATMRGQDCPRDEDVDWQEVAAGLWPEGKAKQLIMHAALCDHCGPLLRAAASRNTDATMSAAPSRPVAKARSDLSFWQHLLQWKVLLPAAALTVVLAVVATRPPSSHTPLQGQEFAAFAVAAHRQHAQGGLALQVRTPSQQKINEWFQRESQLPVALPAPSAAPGEQRPFILEGARLVQIAGKPAAFIAYEVLTPKLQTLPASLIVTSDSAATASGGIEANFKKLSFHYATIEGYKVVTWSLHGLTYALVSQESNSTQRSCMVCHSALKDRDLSQTPTPLFSGTSLGEPVLQ